MAATISINLSWHDQWLVAEWNGDDGWTCPEPSMLRFLKVSKPDDPFSYYPGGEPQRILTAALDTMAKIGIKTKVVIPPPRLSRPDSIPGIGPVVY